GHQFADRPDSLLKFVLRREGWSEAPAQERGPSVLAPYLEVELGPIAEVAAVSPVWVWAEVGPAEVREARSGLQAEPWLLWRGSFDDLERPELLGKLDTSAVAEALGGLGFVGADGARVSALTLPALAAEACEDDGDEVTLEIAHREEAAL